MLETHSNRLSTFAAALRRGESITIAGALFDMDGTLVDSIPAVESAWRIWAQELGISVPSPSMHGKTARAVVVASELAADEYEPAQRRLTEIESRPGQSLDALPGARTLLVSLPQERWGVVTSAARSVALARFGATDLPEPAFRVTGDDVSSSKPAPEPFATGMRLLVAEGHEGVVVAFEDTVAGATSAFEAGCLVIGMLGTDERALLESHAHIVLESLEGVRADSSSGTLRICLI